MEATSITLESDASIHQPQFHKRSADRHGGGGGVERSISVAKAAAKNMVDTEQVADN